MKKKLLIAGAVVAILIVGGIAFWLISPFWLSTKVEEAFPMVPASEEVGAHVITTSTVAILSQGSFVGFDAVHHGKEEIVRLLLDYDVDVNAQDKDGDTPLHNAA